MELFVGMQRRQLFDKWGWDLLNVVVSGDLLDLLDQLFIREPEASLDDQCAESVTFRKGVTPRLPFRRPGLRLAPGSD
jgi:hypothetical protein